MSDPGSAASQQGSQAGKILPSPSRTVFIQLSPPPHRQHAISTRWGAGHRWSELAPAERRSQVQPDHLLVLLPGTWTHPVSARRPGSLS